MIRNFPVENYRKTLKSNHNEAMALTNEKFN